MMFGNLGAWLLSKSSRYSLFILSTVLMASCSVMPPADFPREKQVDLPRYMGAWYVIAHIPPSATKDSYNSIERYQLNESGEIETVFTYREGSFDGEPKIMRPKGFLQEQSNGAVWAMQFIWPIKMEYTISYVDQSYQTTIVARSKRDWVWIMARTPKISEAQYQSLVARVEGLGYSIDKLRKVPQQALSERNDLQVQP